MFGCENGSMENTMKSTGYLKYPNILNLELGGVKVNELEEYSAKELDRLAREREQAIKAKGGLPYVDTRPVGESKLLLLPKIPTDNPDNDGRPRKADFDQIE